MEKTKVKESNEKFLKRVSRIEEITANWDNLPEFAQGTIYGIAISHMNDKKTKETA